MRSAYEALQQTVLDDQAHVWSGLQNRSALYAQLQLLARAFEPSFEQFDPQAVRDAWKITSKIMSEHMNDVDSMTAATFNTWLEMGPVFIGWFSHPA